MDRYKFYTIHLLFRQTGNNLGSSELYKQQLLLL